MVSFGSLQFICVICTDTVFTCVSSPHTFTNDLSLRAAPNRVSQKGSFVPDDCLATYWGRLACLKPLKTPADSGPLAFNFDKQAQRQCFMHQPLPLSPGPNPDPTPTPLPRPWPNTYPSARTLNQDLPLWSPHPCGTEGGGGVISRNLTHPPFRFLGERDRGHALKR